jgi:hypothetical protein
LTHDRSASLWAGRTSFRVRGRNASSGGGDGRERGQAGGGMARWGRETAADTDAAAGDNDDRDGPGSRKTTIGRQWKEGENRWILADDDDVPPPPDLTSPRGEGCRGEVQRRRAIGHPSRSGDGSAHDYVPSPPITRLEHGGARSGPKINEADAGDGETPPPTPTPV